MGRRRRGHHGRHGVPDRWMQYSPVGERIAGTSFIAFKVPLKEDLLRSVPENDRFTTQALMESVPQIGLVIDLTNTDRYYDRQDFLGQGVRYEKIFCRGHEIPSQSVVDKFFSAVDTYSEYLQSCPANPDSEKLIGVHCTHGLNRSGYLVCRYMIRKLGFSPEDAIAAFEKARGYPMEREEYLKHLRQDADCPVLEDSDVNVKNNRITDGSRNNQDFNTHRLTMDRVQHFPQSTRTDSVPSPTWDTGSSNSKDYSRSARADNFQRFHAGARNGFRNFSQSGSPDNVSWSTDNYRCDNFSNSANFSRNTRTAGHPYRLERGASFDPEECVSHNSRAVSRRFYEQEYEENAFGRQRWSDHQSRSASFSRNFRQTQPWQRHRTKDKYYDNHSI